MKKRITIIMKGESELTCKDIKEILEDEVVGDWQDIDIHSVQVKKS